MSDDITTVHVLGTHHASERSAEEVRESITEINPDAVAIELDKKRLHSLANSEGQKSIKDILYNSQIGVRSKLMLIMITTIQSKILSKTEAKMIGVDMMRAYRECISQEYDVILADKDIQTVLSELSSRLGVLSFLKTISSFVVSLIVVSLPFVNGSVDSKPESMEISQMLGMMDEYLPTFKEVLIDDRNTYMVESIKSVSVNYDEIILVTGAAHVPGIKQEVRSSDCLTLDT
jgi:pheromone shutdown protein TraB